MHVGKVGDATVLKIATNLIAAVTVEGAGSPCVDAVAGCGPAQAARKRRSPMRISRRSSA